MCIKFPVREIITNTKSIRCDHTYTGNRRKDSKPDLYYSIAYNKTLCLTNNPLLRLRYHTAEYFIAQVQRTSING